MTAQLLLVDLENVQKVDLVRVPARTRVMVFYGITQKKLPEELVVQRLFDESHVREERKSLLYTF